MTSWLKKGGGTFAGIKMLLCENPLPPLDEAIAAALRGAKKLAVELEKLGVKTFPSETYCFLADMAPYDAETIAARLLRHRILIKPYAGNGTPMGDPVHLMGFSLPRTELFSLVMVGLVLMAGFVAIALSLAEERRKARREAESARALCCENPMVI